jgi:hypothetical protein
VSECSKAGCRGAVSTLTGDADHPRLAKRAALVAPIKVFFDDGFVFEASRREAPDQRDQAMAYVVVTNHILATIGSAPVRRMRSG